jgi:hypothetical protein
MDEFFEREHMYIDSYHFGDKGNDCLALWIQQKIAPLVETK